MRRGERLGLSPSQFTHRRDSIRNACKAARLAVVLETADCAFARQLDLTFRCLIRREDVSHFVELSEVGQKGILRLIWNEIEKAGEISQRGVCRSFDRISTGARHDWLE